MAAKKAAKSVAKTESRPAAIAGGMRVEVTEERLKDSGLSLSKGDIITVPGAVGRRWCELGWSKDVEGKVESGERVPGVSALDVHSAKVKGNSRIGV